MECYEIYKREREEFNNVESYRYVEMCDSFRTLDYIKSKDDSLLCKDDSCEILYKVKETGAKFRKYF